MIRDALVLSGAILACSGAALGQHGFFLESAPARAVGPRGSAATLDAGPTLKTVGMGHVEPPEPRTFQAHDLVQIIINESSVQKYEQTLETEKKYDADATIDSLPSMRHLLEAQLRGSDTTPLAQVGGNGSRKFEGDGTMERKDKFTTRISGTVVEVKPNGLLLVECRSSRVSDDEEVTLVVSGLCRPEDITNANTVQSNQLANLVIRVEQSGEIKNAAKKGVVSKVLDAILAF